MSDTEAEKKKDSGCAWLGGIFALLLGVAYCSNNNDTPATTDASAEAPAQIAEAAAAVEVEALSVEAINIGQQHFRKVAESGVEDGALTYSSNCYSRLTKNFEWAALDRCGAFDQMAVKMATNDSSYFTGNEDTHFQPETVAERYISTATNAGLAADDADTRYDMLQIKAAKLKLPSRKKPAAAATPTPDDSAEFVPDTSDENAEDTENESSTLETVGV